MNLTGFNYTQIDDTTEQYINDYITKYNQINQELNVLSASDPNKYYIKIYLKGEKLDNLIISIIGESPILFYNIKNINTNNISYTLYYIANLLRLLGTTSLSCDDPKKSIKYASYRHVEVEFIHDNNINKIQYMIFKDIKVTMCCIIQIIINKINESRHNNDLLSIE